MAALFESTEINGMRINNRFVRSATYEAMAGPDGVVQDQLVHIWRNLPAEALA